MKKAVILAAGEGRRLRPFTEDIPKVMIPIANKPILEHVVEALVKNGIKDIVLVVGYHKEKIMQHFGNGKNFNVNIEYVRDDKEIGTGYALYQTKDVIDDDFFMLPGDNIITEKTFKDFSDSPIPSSLLTKSKNASKYGVVTLKNKKVIEIEEKPKEIRESMICTGIFNFNKDIFKYLKIAIENNQFDMTSAIKASIKEQNMKGIITTHSWMDAVYPWNILTLNSHSLQHIKSKYSGKIDSSVSLKGKVEIGEGCRIGSNVNIIGPVIIGDNVEIEANTTILHSTSIGDNVTIGVGSYIENTVIFDDVIIKPHAFLEDAIIGFGAYLGPKFTTYSENVRKIVNDEIHDIENIGALIASDVIIGANVVVEPGVIIGNDAEIKSLNVVKKDVDSYSLVV